MDGSTGSWEDCLLFFVPPPSLYISFLFQEILPRRSCFLVKSCHEDPNYLSYLSCFAYKMSKRWGGKGSPVPAAEAPGWPAGPGSWRHLSADSVLPLPWQGNACLGLHLPCQIIGDPGLHCTRGGFCSPRTLADNKQQLNRFRHTVHPEKSVGFLHSTSYIVVSCNSLKAGLGADNYAELWYRRAGGCVVASTACLYKSYLSSSEAEVLG